MYIYMPHYIATHIHSVGYVNNDKEPLLSALLEQTILLNLLYICNNKIMDNE